MGLYILNYSTFLDLSSICKLMEQQVSLEDTLFVPVFPLHFVTAKHCVMHGENETHHKVMLSTRNVLS